MKIRDAAAPFDIYSVSNETIFRFLYILAD